MTAPGACPFTIDHPVMGNRWSHLTFLHWRYDAEAVQRLLPDGLEVETFDGSAWVALVPFRMTVSLPGGRTLPWASRFLETNVRTYARDREGRSGVWFMSLDASRFGAVGVARTAYRLPYFWSHMRSSTIGSPDAEGGVITYTGRRRWPGPRGAHSEVTVAIGPAIPAADVTPLEHFLTARFFLFSRSGATQRFGRAWHEPWVLHRAEVRHLDDRFVAASGLPEPVDPPLVHYSPGVDVLIGRPERYARP